MNTNGTGHAAALPDMFTRNPRPENSPGAPALFSTTPEFFARFQQEFANARLFLLYTLSPAGDDLNTAIAQFLAIL